MIEHILIVDDQVSFSNHIRAILENENYSVATAHNADQAIGIISSEPVDILLTDMKMPGMNGLELYKVAKKINPDISSIVMTAYGTDQRRLLTLPGEQSNPKWSSSMNKN